MRQKRHFCHQKDAKRALFYDCKTENVFLWVASHDSESELVINLTDSDLIRTENF